MISLVSSSAKTSDFISPKDVKDQLLKTLRFTWKFCAKSIFVFFLWNGGRICGLGDAYASPKMWAKNVLTLKHIQREYP